MSIPEILEAIWGMATFLATPITAIPDRALVYASVLCCGLSMVAMTVYVRRQFSRAHRVLAMLSTEWEAAESEFMRIAGVAERKMGGLAVSPSNRGSSAPAPEPQEEEAKAFPLVDAGPDLPRQVAAMARKGLDASEIGATLGLEEAEVNVLFGMHRVTQRKK